MLGHRQGRQRGLAAQHRRRVGGGDHDDRTGEAGGPQIVGDEFLHFAPALADQADHRDVAVRPARQHRQQDRLADARTGKETEPLPLTQGGEQVERADRRREAWAHSRPRGRRRRRCAKRGGPRSLAKGTLAIERPAKTVDHAAEPAGAGLESIVPAQQFGGRARDQSVGRVEGHGGGALAVDGGHFGLDRSIVSGETKPGADGRRAGQSPHLQHRSLDPQQAPEAPMRIERADGRGERRQAFESAQAATSSTPTSASFSQRIKARQSPRAR